MSLRAEAGRWNTFIIRLDSVERKLPYVVLNYLKTILSPAWGTGETESEKDTFLEEAFSKGIAETYEIDNPKRPGRTALAIRLNRSHEIVKQLLK